MTLQLPVSLMNKSLCLFFHMSGSRGWSFEWVCLCYCPGRKKLSHSCSISTDAWHDSKAPLEKDVYEYSASISIPFTIQQNSIDMHVISRLYTKWRAIYLFSQHLGCDNQVIGIIWCEVTRPITFWFDFTLKTLTVDTDHGLKLFSGQTVQLIPHYY